MSDCSNSNRIDKLEKTMYGNGQPGLIQIVSSLNTTVANFDNTLKDNATALRSLLKFMNEEKGKEKIEDKYNRNNKWIVGLSITTILSLIGIIVSILV